MKTKVHFTFDYELYFGEETGSAERCLLQPTSELIRIAERYQVRFVFFVDIGYLLRLDHFRKQYPSLNSDYESVTAQIKLLHSSGHDVQLHVHPHWEDSIYDGQKWKIDVRRYKLADFEPAAAAEIFSRYKRALEELTGSKPTVYRAGGWCIQPFSAFRELFLKEGIRIDSSVFSGGYFSSDQYAYDFRNAPDKGKYRFEEDVNVEVKDGSFVELPIASIRNNPLFFWRLFWLGRRNPALHKPLGNGRAMAAPGYRKKLLTRFTTNPVSVDGYNARLLETALRQTVSAGKEHLVIIGHPKALSPYSLRQIETFVSRHRVDCHIKNMSNE